MRLNTEKLNTGTVGNKKIQSEDQKNNIPVIIWSKHS